MVGHRVVGVARGRPPRPPSPPVWTRRRSGWCGCAGRPGCPRPGHQRRAACRAAAASTSPRSSRRVGGTHGQPERAYTSSSVAETTSAPSSTRYRPYSESFSPVRTAISRIRTLCCLEPVKYCSAAPHDSAGTTRRSTCSPRGGPDRGLLVPRGDHLGDQRQRGERLHQRLRVGRRRPGCRCRRSSPASAAATRRTRTARSRAPATARRRSPRPAPWRRRAAPGPRRRGHSSMPCSRFSAVLGAEPAQVGEPPVARSPAPARPTEAMPSSLYSTIAFFGPSPGIAVIARTPAGILARSFSTAST